LGKINHTAEVIHSVEDIHHVEVKSAVEDIHTVGGKSINLSLRRKLR